ncbi:Heat shock protein 67Bb [Strigomonas culicis]|uniref:Sulfurtransferase n=1 Tax=Strigomonas culicis TaxID=28005 RepID=S9UIS3_9TRYP|nr:Heat shock protein 67Bb [Strigomonas culicis]EPY35683.1 Heat shock protein 67Bb [Strigomonas culicis]|eukprot:EPY30732.1 Heat shock protein 67Bb [Strigomonas culicis]
MQRYTYATMEALVKSKLNGNALDTCILDVRGKDEVSSTGTIPTAVHIPLDQLDAALRKSAEEFSQEYGFTRPSSSQPVVTYCLKGMRAEKAAAILSDHKYENVSIYPGSWTEWSENYVK